ncbi:hypothetical protein FKP32DRAFT_587316 [Trametes sanguinea]|nr:hypothetical protein FKP32DRAFT_587316 [Trametes sanguinea]
MRTCDRLLVLTNPLSSDLTASPELCGPQSVVVVGIGIRSPIHEDNAVIGWRARHSIGIMGSTVHLRYAQPHTPYLVAEMVLYLVTCLLAEDLVSCREQLAFQARVSGGRSCPRRRSACGGADRSCANGDSSSTSLLAGLYPSFWVVCWSRQRRNYAEPTP